MSILIFSWNVNGIRALVSKLTGGLVNLFTEYNADIFCFQETKTGSKRLLEDDVIHVPGYESFWSFCATKQGYSGVVTYARKGTTLNAYVNFKNSKFMKENLKNFDDEGRFVVTDHGLFVLVNVYFPNGRRSNRMEYRLRFCQLYSDICSDFISQGKQVIVTGDINIAHQPIDVHDPARAESEHQSCFYPESRNWFSDFLSRNFFSDAFRVFHPTERKYTCWDSKTQARMVDHGCRIDYYLVSAGLLPTVIDCNMYGHQLGSDHCPVFLTVRGVLPRDLPPTPLSSDFRRERQLSMRDFFCNRKGGVTNATVTNVAVTNAVVTDAAVTDAIVTDAAVTDAVVTDAIVTDAIVTDAVVTDSAITNEAVTDAAVTDAVITNAAVTDAAVTNAAVTNAVITNAAVTDAAVTNAVVTDATATNAVVTDVAVTDAVVTDVAVTDTDITNVTVTNITLTDVAVTDPTRTDVPDNVSYKKKIAPNENSKKVKQQQNSILGEFPKQGKKRKLQGTAPRNHVKKAKPDPEPHGNTKQMSLMSFFSPNTLPNQKKKT